jgi:hypothetical protein
VRSLPLMLRAILGKGARSKAQWNRTLLLVKNFKLVARPLDEGPRPRQIKLWFSLHGIILEGKPIGPDQKKSLKDTLWFWKPKCRLKLKVAQFLFIYLFHCCLLHFWLNFCKNGRHAMDWGHCWQHINSPIFDQF